MPGPTIWSRYRFCSAFVDEFDNLILTDPSPFTQANQGATLGDNITLTTSDADTLTTLAYRYYRRADLWWVIADFAGIYDPTIPLTPGTQLTIPSSRTVTELILSERRRSEFQS